MRFVEFASSGRKWLVPEPFSKDGSPEPIGLFPPNPPLPENPSFLYSTKLLKFLSGKQLLLEEIPFPLKELHEHYLNGYLTYEPGIVLKDGQPHCQRCGNTQKRLFASFSCTRCGEKSCFYCRKCIMMGRISMCTPLLRWTGCRYNYPKRNSALAWKGTLSEGQRRASEHVAAAVGRNKELLVWAVCGAGKTEVLFQGLGQALCKGMRVCLASPRTDVILELAPRIREVFPYTEIAALYGGSKENRNHGQLVLSTAHQLLRFKQAFDFVVIDEVDAFPFNTDETLQYAVNQAKKSDASVVYLSATPDHSLKTRVRAGELLAVKIPKRYHNHPLPVPEFIWCGNWKRLVEKNRLPEKLLEWVVEVCKRGQQAFVFVPSVSIMGAVARLLKSIKQRIEAVHAEDAKRREKVEQFRNGDFPILVTTTILERGVTVPGVQAAVFGADDAVFTEQALVQMAGRVGRSSNAPSGDVMFFHGGKTKAMAAARNHIISMNREGFEKENK